MTVRQVGKHTNMVVGALIGVALIYVTFRLAGPLWGAGLCLLLLYESWTLTNSYPEDTLSESIWRLSARPMVPWLFGLATGWAFATGFISNPWLCLAVGFLEGHFFFQAQGEMERQQEERVEVAAATGVVPGSGDPNAE